MPAQKAQPLATFAAVQWLRGHWVAFLLWSCALLVPCFWHGQVQACDLGSHLYTASLTPAVERGELPGLHIDPQFTNVLVDFVLSHAIPSIGVIAAQRLLAGFCVMVFFWGAFALACCAADETAWTVAPLLAMISYGAIFHWGFFNFYLSAGFSLWALAIVVRGIRSDVLWIPLLLILAALAHPMGAAALVFLGFYLRALRRLETRSQLRTSAVLLIAAVAARFYAVRHFQVLPREIKQYWMLGADQLLVFGHPYFGLAVATLIFCVIAIIFELLRNPALEIREITSYHWLQFYTVVALIVFIAPGGLVSDATFGMMGYLPDRGSLYSAVALAMLIASCRPKRWFPISIGIIAIFFFVALHRDTGLLERRTEAVAALVQSHPNERIISIIPPIAGWRIHEDHSLDRACVEHCYSFNNYEPSTFQFRLHADDGNQFVAVDQEALDDMKDGDYLVKAQDIPLYEVYPCGPQPTDVCLTALHAGQPNGEVPNLFPPH